MEQTDIKQRLLSAYQSGDKSHFISTVIDASRMLSYKEIGDAIGVSKQYIGELLKKHRPFIVRCTRCYTEMQYIKNLGALHRNLCPKCYKEYKKNKYEKYLSKRREWNKRKEKNSRLLQNITDELYEKLKTTFKSVLFMPSNCPFNIVINGKKCYMTTSNVSFNGSSNIYQFRCKFNSEIEYYVLCCKPQNDIIIIDRETLYKLNEHKPFSPIGASGKVCIHVSILEDITKSKYSKYINAFNLLENTE